MGVTPPTIGLFERTRQAQAPLSASTAVRKPPHCVKGASGLAEHVVGVERLRPGPGLAGARADDIVVGLELHREAPVDLADRDEVRGRIVAGPFHSAPPAEPGQKCVLVVVVNLTSAFSIRFTGTL